MVGLLAYMYLVLTFETVLQYYTHLALYLNTIFLALIVSRLNARPNEMMAKSGFRRLAEMEDYMKEYIAGRTLPILVKW
jgi:hypothetical protein